MRTPISHDHDRDRAINAIRDDMTRACDAVSREIDRNRTAIEEGVIPSGWKVWAIRGMVAAVAPGISRARARAIRRAGTLMLDGYLDVRDGETGI